MIFDKLLYVFIYVADRSGRTVRGVGVWRISSWDCGLESHLGRGCLCCVCCIGTIVWNTSDMKKEGKIQNVPNGSKEKTGFENSPTVAWRFVSCECCVLPGKGLCFGLVTRPEESYRVWCVWVWSWSLNNEEVVAHLGLFRQGKKNLKECDKFIISVVQSTGQYNPWCWPNTSFQIFTEFFKFLGCGRFLDRETSTATTLRVLIAF
jgi:hypothetical protein